MLISGFGKHLPLILAITALSCRPRSGSSAVASVPVASSAAQAAMLADLRTINDPAVDKFIANLKANSDGTFTLIVDGQALVINPAGVGGAAFSDFFTAFNNSVASLLSAQFASSSSVEQIANTQHNLYTLIKAQSLGDLNLAQRLVRDSVLASADAGNTPTSSGNIGIATNTGISGNTGIGSGAASTSLALNDSGTASGNRGIGSAMPANPVSVVNATGPYSDDAVAFHQQRELYLLNGLNNLLGLMSTPPPAASGQYVASSGDPNCVRRQRLVSPSILPFHRGDLDRMCQTQVDRFVGLGFHRITIFYPVHYSGGFYDDPTEPVPASPAYGIDYRFETLNAPDAGELGRCINYIISRGLELTYLPHIESIVTMNSAGESEWRIFARILFDEPTFYNLAYAPLVQALNANATHLTGTTTISLAAELDTSFYHAPDTVQTLIQHLVTSLQLRRSSYLLTFNPNGDTTQVDEFAPVYQARGINGCAVLQTLLTGGSIDGLGPSTYDAYGHIAPPYNSGASAMAAPDFPTTRSFFLSNWSAALEGNCPGLGAAVSAKFATSYGCGEFSMQGPRASFYRQFFEGALSQESGNFSRFNLWTSGQSQFDPLTGSDTTAALQAFQTACD